MTQQYWFVIADTADQERVWEEFGKGKLQFNENFGKYGFFTNKIQATNFAESLAKQNPGIDVQIGSTTQGFYTPPATKISQKIWTETGEYIPL